MPEFGVSTIPCPKESKQQKECSPGVVESSEPIVYILIDPLNYQNGKLLLSAFPKKRLKNCTLSVARGHHCTVADAMRHVVEPQLARDGRRRLVGAFRTQCSKIRELQASKERVRVFCVVDDGSCEYPAHAHIGYSEATKADGFWSHNDRTAAHANLARAFENGGILQLQDCFAP